MPSDLHSYDETHAKLDLEKRYNVFLSDPHDHHGQIELFNAITVQMTEAKYETTLNSVQKHAMRCFIDMCHVVIRDNVTLYEKHNTRFERLLFSKDAWRLLAEANEEYLIAAFLIALQYKEGNLQSNYGAIQALTSMSNHKFQGFPDNYKYVIASELFGEAWATLYIDELTNSFRDNYRVIASSTPPFVCRGIVLAVDAQRDSSLPHDF